MPHYLSTNLIRKGNKFKYPCILIIKDLITHSMFNKSSSEQINVSSKRRFPDQNFVQEVFCSTHAQCVFYLIFRQFLCSYISLNLEIFRRCILWVLFKICLVEATSWCKKYLLVLHSSVVFETFLTNFILRLP